MAHKQILKVVDGVEMKGFMVNGHFITQLLASDGGSLSKDEQGWVAFDTDDKKVAEAKTQSKIIDMLKPKKAEDKVMYIVVLPPQARLPEGHVLRCAMSNGQPLKTHIQSFRDEIEMDQFISESLRSAVAKEYAVKQITRGRVNYRVTVSNFRTNPIGTLEFLQRPRQQNQFESSEEQRSDLPF